MADGAFVVVVGLVVVELLVVDAGIGVWVAAVLVVCFTVVVEILEGVVVDGGGTVVVAAAASSSNFFQSG